MKQILKLLENDARLSLEQIAKMTGKTTAEVAELIEDYEKKGVILGYKTMINWERAESDSVTALIQLKVTPQKGMGFDDIAKQIYKLPDVQSVYLMSGGYDLTVIITGNSMKDIARMVSEDLAPMETVLSTGTHFVMKKYKDQGMIFDPSSKDNREVLISW